MWAVWLFDPSYSAFNWVLATFGIDPVPWTGDAYWARFSVILVNIWIGAPFFMIMYLAALKSVPEQLYEAAEIDGANWWQRMWYVALPMMCNIIAITALFSLDCRCSPGSPHCSHRNGGRPNRHDARVCDPVVPGGHWRGDILLGRQRVVFMVPILATPASHPAAITKQGQ